MLLHTLPIFHVHGLFVALHCAMLSGNEVIFLPRFDVADVVEHLPQATVMMGVPTQYTRLLAHQRQITADRDASRHDPPEFDAAACRSIRLFTSGSAPMTEAVHAEFTARTGQQILERYGMTEAGMITSNPYDGDRVPGTVGFPLPDVELRVCDDDGNPVATGETGVVEIRSPGLFAGYWQMPEKTASEHRDGGWFVTGDVGSVDAEGRLTLEGRSSDMIISGGYNVYPKEVEMVLDELPGVLETAVIGVPHPDFGEAVVAVVVRDGHVDDHRRTARRIARRRARPVQTPQAVRRHRRAPPQRHVEDPEGSPAHRTLRSLHRLNTDRLARGRLQGDRLARGRDGHQEVGRIGLCYVDPAARRHRRATWMGVPR